MTIALILTGVVKVLRVSTFQTFALAMLSVAAVDWRHSISPGRARDRAEREINHDDGVHHGGGAGLVAATLVE